MADRTIESIAKRVLACCAAVVLLIGSASPVHAGASIRYVGGAAHGGWHRSGFKSSITGGKAAVWYPGVLVHLRTIKYSGVQASVSGSSFVYLSHPAIGYAESNCRTTAGSQFDCYYFRP